jgi:hypothetical protein
MALLATEARGGANFRNIKNHGLLYLFLFHGFPFVFENIDKSNI